MGFSRSEPRASSAGNGQASSVGTDSQHELMMGEVHPGAGTGPYTPV